MKILLLGKNGQLGWELQRSLCLLGDLVSLDRQGTGTADGCGDLTQIESLIATVHRFAPDVIVNAAAHTAVDKAESEPDLAYLVNATAPCALAVAAKQMGALLVHYSTDHVFDGSGNTAWSESSATGPVNTYGRTKLEGERMIAASGARHLIFRTSWVYAARGDNFASTMLQLARKQKHLKVIDDQFGAPTSAELVADVTSHAVRQALHQTADDGLYHLTAHGETSWHRYARFVIDTAMAMLPSPVWAVREIAPVSTCNYPSAAHRPLNARLDSSRICRSFGLQLPPWEQGVIRMLKLKLAESRSDQSGGNGRHGYALPTHT